MSEKIKKYLKNSIGEKGNYCYSLPVETTKAVIKELERLNNIINELEKEIISQIEICKEGQVLEAKVRSPFDTYSGDIRAYKYLLYKLKALKEENKDAC